MQLTGTHINYYFICHRKLWLFANGIQMEHTSELVSEGNLIHENSYPQRSEKYEEIQIEGIRIDYYDPKNKIIHEIKKSNKKEKAHEWQLKYYIYMFEKQGIEEVSGILEYPKLRKTEQVNLSENDKLQIKEMLIDITKIINSSVCHSIPEKAPCSKCSYYDFTGKSIKLS